MIDHVVLFSGGVGSWAAAKRVAAEHGTENLYLLFTDTKSEDEDLYRFLPEAAENVGGQLIWIADGRDVWETFFDRQFIGNTRVDVCSKALKRDMSRKWFKDNCDPANTVVYLGIDWSELHRYEKARPRWEPFELKAPLCEPPYLTKDQIFDWLASEGIKRPRLYDMGMPHNNCGGFCVKAGHAQFVRLLQVMPERYKYHEEKEEEVRLTTGKDVAILKDRRGGTTKPLTLKVLRERVENGEYKSKRLDDWGGCGCFAGAV